MKEEVGFETFHVPITIGFLVESLNAAIGEGVDKEGQNIVHVAFAHERHLLHAK